MIQTWQVHFTHEGQPDYFLVEAFQVTVLNVSQVMIDGISLDFNESALISANIYDE